MNKYNININHESDIKSYYLPYLIIINIMLPIKIKNNKTVKGIQLILYSKLSEKSCEILKLYKLNKSIHQLPESMINKYR